ncbi:MAG TPA: GreA/GreB family elongation factor, partial [Acidiphilium sp.]
GPALAPSVEFEMEIRSMSRAFVSEDAAAAKAAILPERPVSDRPNLVTERGLRLIEAEVARLQEAIAKTVSDSEERPALARDLRYWQARKASARMMGAAPAAPSEVAFGTTVTLRRQDGGTVRYRIVGEDEADPAQGLLSWASPLAEAMMEAETGDEIDLPGRPPMTVAAITRD